VLPLCQSAAASRARKLRLQRIDRIFRFAQARVRRLYLAD
jgi:hypothetical protein